MPSPPGGKSLSGYRSLPVPSRFMTSTLGRILVKSHSEINDAFASAVRPASATSAARSLVQQSLSSRVSQSFEPAMGAELVEYPLNVIPNRHARNGEPPANPVSAYPLREKIQDLQLPFGQSPLLRNCRRSSSLDHQYD